MQTLSGARRDDDHVLVIIADTHCEGSVTFEGPLAAAISSSDRVIHAGDFTTETAHSSIAERAKRLVAVHGNSDSQAVVDRLPPATTCEFAGVRIAVTHRHESGQMGLAMFGRSRGADLVVFGHTHRPMIVETGDLALLNPGSHAEPRGHRPGYATLQQTDSGVTAAIRALDGTVIEQAFLSPRSGR